MRYCSIVSQVTESTFETKSRPQTVYISGCLHLFQLKVDNFLFASAVHLHDCENRFQSASF